MCMQVSKSDMKTARKINMRRTRIHMRPLRIDELERLGMIGKRTHTHSTRHHVTQ